MDDLETIQAIDKASKKNPEEENLIRLSSGVVLRGKRASSTLLIEVLTSSRRPKPPTYKNEKMGRLMENPDDPDYIEQVQAYKYEQAGTLVTAMIMMGTEILSIPEGMEGPHPYKPSAVSGQRLAKGKKQKAEGSDELVWPKWLGEYELLKLPMNPENETWRYLTWVKFKAAPGDEDLKKIQEVVGRLSGVREADADAAEEFPERNQENR